MIAMIMMKYYLVAECWSARIIVSRQEVRLSVRDKEVSQRVFKSARSYLHITQESCNNFNCTLLIKILLLVCSRQEVGGEPGLGKGRPINPVKQGLQSHRGQVRDVHLYNVLE